MYTGIVQGTASLKRIDENPGLKTFYLAIPESLQAGLVIGASVALDGVCMTVTSIADGCVSFDAMQQTLAVTTLGNLRVGDRVNVERSAAIGEENGGHEISGHVDGVVEVVAIDTPENNRIVTYKVPDKAIQYLFPQGFIALNGCSLTIAGLDKSRGEITVCFIPETLRVTTHGEKKLGDHINFEIDKRTQAIVDTVRAFLSEHKDDVIPAQN